VTTDINQFNIDQDKLSKSNKTGKPYQFMEIGEAEVVTNIFGKSTVRVIGKQGNANSIWIKVAAVVAIGIAVTLWLDYEIALQQEPFQPAVVSTAPIVNEQTGSSMLQAATAKPVVPNSFQDKNKAEIAAPEVKPSRTPRTRHATIAASGVQATTTTGLQTKTSLHEEVMPAAHAVVDKPAVPVVNNDPSAPSTIVVETAPVISPQSPEPERKDRQLVPQAPILR
jgi:hypothetical protein